VTLIILGLLGCSPHWSLVHGGDICCSPSFKMIVLIDIDLLITVIVDLHLVLKEYIFFLLLIWFILTFYDICGSCLKHQRHCCVECHFSFLYKVVNFCRYRSCIYMCMMVALSIYFFLFRLEVKISTNDDPFDLMWSWGN
jgi:hypothetical protein